MALDNLIKLSDDLQNMPLQNVQEYANGSNPEVPSWLAATELQRRASIQQQQEAFQNTNPQTVTQKLLQNLAAPLRQNPAAQGQQVNPAAPQPGIAGLAAPQQAAQQPVQAAHGGLMHLPVNMFKQHNFAPGGIIAFKSGTGDDTVGDATEQQRLANQTAAYVEGAQIAAAQRAADERANSPAPTPASLAKLGQEEDNSSSKYHSVLGRNLSNWLGSAMSGLGQSQANAGLSEAGLPTIVNPPSAAPAAPTAAPAAAPVVPAAAAPATPQATPPVAPPVARRAPPAPPVTPADMTGFYNQPSSPLAAPSSGIPSIIQASAVDKFTPDQQPYKAPASPLDAIQNFIDKNTAKAKQVDVPTLEKSVEAQKHALQLVGIGESPYASIEQKIKALEAKRALQEAQDPMDRLIGQLAAFSQADPSKGFGYAAGQMGVAGLKMKQEQQALRDKQDAEMLGLYSGLNKEDLAFKMGNLEKAQGTIKEREKQQSDAEKAATEQTTAQAHLGSAAASALSAATQASLAPSEIQSRLAAAGLSKVQASRIMKELEYLPQVTEAQIQHLIAQAHQANKPTDFEAFKAEPEKFGQFKNLQGGAKDFDQLVRDERKNYANIGSMIDKKMYPTVNDYLRSQFPENADKFPSPNKFATQEDLQTSFNKYKGQTISGIKINTIDDAKKLAQLQGYSIQK